MITLSNKWLTGDQQLCPNETWMVLYWTNSCVTILTQSRAGQYFAVLQLIYHTNYPPVLFQYIKPISIDLHTNHYLEKKYIFRFRHWFILGIPDEGNTNAQRMNHIICIVSCIMIGIILLLSVPLQTYLPVFQRNTIFKDHVICSVPEEGHNQRPCNCPLHLMIYCWFGLFVVEYRFPTSNGTLCFNQQRSMLSVHTYLDILYMYLYMCMIWNYFLLQSWTILYKWSDKFAECSKPSLLPYPCVGHVKLSQWLR